MEQHDTKRSMETVDERDRGSDHDRSGDLSRKADGCGLRYPVETILELLSSGMTHDEILDDYPDLEREDILAVLDYHSAPSSSDSVRDTLDQS